MNFGKRFNIPKFSNWKCSENALTFDMNNIDFRFKHFGYAYAGIATAYFVYLTGRDKLDPSPKTDVRKSHGKFGIVQINTNISRGIPANICDSIMFPFAWAGIMHEVKEP